MLTGCAQEKKNQNYLFRFLTFSYQPNRAEQGKGKTFIATK